MFCSIDIARCLANILSSISPNDLIHFLLEIWDKYPLSHVTRAAIHGDVFHCFGLIGSLESPPSILVTRNPNWSFRDSKASDWLRKGKVLAPLVRPT